MAYFSLPGLAVLWPAYGLYLPSVIPVFFYICVVQAKDGNKEPTGDVRKSYDSKAGGASSWPVVVAVVGFVLCGKI